MKIKGETTMTGKTMINKGKLDVTTRIIHLGLVIFGLAAWLTGDGAGDYKRADYSDFTLHKWLGMALAAVILIRVLYGVFGPRILRFSGWLPYTKERLKLAGEALLSAALYRAPSRPAHTAVSGLIQGFGIALFLWMALTGSGLFLLIEPGHKAVGFAHLVKELHEIGEGLIPFYLAVHVGAVVIHAFFGLDIWRKMLFMKKPSASLSAVRGQAA